MRTTVPQRQQCYLGHTLSRPSMETTTKMHTSLDTLLMTDCCLRGTHTNTQTNTSHSIWRFCEPKWLKAKRNVLEVFLEFSDVGEICWNLECDSLSAGIFNDFLLRKQLCSTRHPFRWIHCVCVHRVLEQHKLTKEQWEDRIQTWHEEHRGMLRYMSNFPHRILYLKQPKKVKKHLCLGVHLWACCVM